jgi:hypothetical protein
VQYLSTYKGIFKMASRFAVRSDCLAWRQAGQWSPLVQFAWSRVFVHLSLDFVLAIFVGRDSVVGIATRYELDGPGVESWWERDFQHPSIPALGSTQPPVQWVKRPVRGVDHPPPSSAEVKERVELYIYSTSGLSWPVLGWSLPLPYPVFNVVGCCLQASRHHQNIS